jgi:hypothetical protein
MSWFDQTENPEVQDFQKQNPEGDYANPFAAIRSQEQLGSQYAKTLNEQAAFERQQGVARAAALAAAEKRINDQRAQSSSEQWLRISQALLSPTSMPGIKGMLANLSPALADMATMKRKAQQSREEQLAALREQYAAEGVTSQRGMYKSTLDALRAQGQMMKPQKAHTGFNPITGQLVDMETGAPVADAQLPTYTPEEVAKLSADPRNRGTRFRTADGRVMEIH